MKKAKSREENLLRGARKAKKKNVVQLRVDGLFEILLIKMKIIKRQLIDQKATGQRQLINRQLIKRKLTKK